MAIMRLVCTLTVMVVLAGCTEAPGAEPTSSEPEESMSVEANQTVEPTLETAVIDWQDRLVRGAWICTREVRCQFAPSQSVYDGAVFEQALPAGNVTSGDLTLTWDPVSQITEELVFGFRIDDPDCDDCPGRYGTEISGASPLTLTLSTDLYVEQGDVLRLWVYGAMIHGESTTGTYAGTSDDQPVMVEGDIVIEQRA